MYHQYPSTYLQYNGPGESQAFLLKSKLNALDEKSEEGMKGKRTRRNDKRRENRNSVAFYTVCIQINYDSDARRYLYEIMKIVLYRHAKLNIYRY